MSNDDDLILVEAICEFVECGLPYTHAIVQDTDPYKQGVLGFYCQEHADDMVGFLRAVMEDETIRIVEIVWPDLYEITFVPKEKTDE